MFSQDPIEIISYFMSHAVRTFLLCRTTGTFLLCLHAQHEFNRKCGVGGFPFRCRQVRHMFIYFTSLLC